MSCWKLKIFDNLHNKHFHCSLSHSTIDGLNVERRRRRWEAVTLIMHFEGAKGCEEDLLKGSHSRLYDAATTAYPQMEGNFLGKGRGRVKKTIVNYRAERKSSWISILSWAYRNQSLIYLAGIHWFQWLSSAHERERVSM